VRTLQQIADALVPGVRAVAPGKTLTQAEVEIINALAELLHRREAAPAQTPFDRALAAVLIHEGGYSNNPRDPGGATNKGITQRVYDDWRRGQGAQPRSVQMIADAEVAAIYKQNYWDKVRGDDLPAGVGYAVFDFAVNSGVSRAAKFLQAAVGVAQDGVIGPATVAAAAAAPRTAIEMLMDARLAFLRGLETFDTFGRGWTTRCADVRCAALEMVG
jgi:lysozyme family protein